MNSLVIKTSTIRYLLFALISIIFYFLLRIPFFTQVQSTIKGGDVEHYYQVAGGDVLAYYLIANNLKKNGTYAESGIIPSEVASWRPPVWPYVLSKFILIGKSFKVQLFLKICMELIFIILASYLVFLVTDKIALVFIVFLFFAIEPQFLKYSGAMLSENLSALLLLITSLLWIYILFKDRSILVHIIFGICCGVIPITHPVALFFVFLLLFFYILKQIRDNSIFKLTTVCFFFFVVAMIWPIRNQVVFERGMFITASQGATLSKGWNYLVPSTFTNTQGDLANEGINLMYLKPSEYNKENNYGILDLKELYTKATIKFIRQADLSLLFDIALKKLKSNFNPFPETPKPGIKEFLGSLFRIWYLITFLVCLFIHFTGDNVAKHLLSLKLASIVLILVYISQSLMSIAVYTGLRFNAVYGLTLVFCTVFIWYNLFSIWIESRKKSKSPCAV